MVVVLVVVVVVVEVVQTLYDAHASEVSITRRDGHISSQHRERRRLASTINSQQTETLAARYADGQPVDRQETVVEDFRQLTQHYGVRVGQLLRCTPEQSHRMHLVPTTGDNNDDKIKQC